MNEVERGTVINLNAYGATVRLEGGSLAGVPLPDVDKHRAAYERALASRKTLEFLIRPSGRNTIAMLAPQLRDDALEEQIALYLKSTEEWEKPDLPPAHERHFLRKKRRAAIFESRHAADR